MSGSSLDALRARFPRVAVVHEWLTIPGGSEDVVIELLEMFPHAELFTSIYDPAPWPEIVTERPVHASYLSRLPGAKTHYPKLLPFMTRAYRSFDFSGFDLILSSSHACAKNIRTPPGALHVCYCHTPMRYAWDESLLEGEEIGRATRLALPLMLRRLRRQDVQGASSPDVFVANSHNVADRIRRYYGRTAEVVNPPVEVDRLLTLPRGPEDHYLVFGRVVPYKRVELAVAACARLGRGLKVAGDGRAMASVRAAAGGHPRDRAAGQGRRRRARRLDVQRARPLVSRRGGFRDRACRGPGRGLACDRLSRGRAHRRLSSTARRASCSTSRVPSAWPARSSVSRACVSRRPRFAPTPSASGASASVPRWPG